ncbi:hypothetical protein BDZ45DRAFT_700103 [Acephala macrosclerotiorum]|nr:hypothetical protein BDZ45DRAFT_700103 [Acephala macrosclerotiorum]
MNSSSFRGLTTSVWNWGSRKAVLIFLKKSCRTVPSNFGVIFWGFMLTFIPGTFWLPSGFKAPARSLQKVVLPVPFSPIMTMISESVKSPDSMLSLNSPRVFCMDGYLKARVRSTMNSSAASAIRKVKDSSLNRRFSMLAR